VRRKSIAINQNPNKQHKYSYLKDVRRYDRYMNYLINAHANDEL